MNRMRVLFYAVLVTLFVLAGVVVTQGCGSGEITPC